MHITECVYRTAGDPAKKCLICAKVSGHNWMEVRILWSRRTTRVRCVVMARASVSLCSFQFQAFNDQTLSKLSSHFCQLKNVPLCATPCVISVNLN